VIDDRQPGSRSKNLYKPAARLQAGRLASNL
jgi:hypothetical protein